MRGIILLAGLAIAAPVLAQDTTTSCRRVGNEVQCDTRQKKTFMDMLEDGKALVPDYQPSQQTSPPPIAPLAPVAPQTPRLPDDPFATGNNLLETCKLDDSACVLFIHALSEGFSLGVAFGKAPPLACPPPGVHAGQKRDVVVKWLNDHPAERHRQGAALIIVALRDAFPCKAANP